MALLPLCWLNQKVSLSIRKVISLKYLAKSVAVFLILLSFGCQAVQKPVHQPENISSSKIQTDADLAAKAEKIAQSVSGVDDSVAVVVNKDVSVGLKVSGFNRLRLKTIRSEVHQAVRSTVGDVYKIHVTTDKKIYTQLADIKQEIKRNKLNDNLLKVFNKANEDMKG